MAEKNSLSTNEKSETKKLTPKQERFVAEYLIDLNATQAAIRAGYSEKNADKIGPELLGNSRVRAAVDAEKSNRMQRVNVDADYVLRRLYEMAEADRADLYDANGNLLPVSEWPEVWRKGMVTGIEINALFEGQGEDRIQIGEVKKIRTETPLAILQTLGKHIKVNAFQENVKIAGLDALADRLERAMRKNG
jgi:phage terminase small subunit